jgi:hypothetical protein
LCGSTDIVMLPNGSSLVILKRSKCVVERPESMHYAGILVVAELFLNVVDIPMQ